MNLTSFSESKQQNYGKEKRKKKNKNEHDLQRKIVLNESATKTTKIITKNK